MSRNIIFVDGSVGVGKTTFINILQQAFKTTLECHCNGRGHRPNVEVLPEPLHREWTSQIALQITYPTLLQFLLARKKVAIENWSNKIASDGLQELEHNVLIVERSPGGDRRVREGFTEFWGGLNPIYSGENIHNVLVQRATQEEWDVEQKRLNDSMLILEKYAGNSCCRVIRPKHISEYYKDAAYVVHKVLKL